MQQSVMDRNESSDDDASVQVVTAVADADDVDPLDLDFVLGRHVDADALDKLVDHATDRDTGVTVQFTVDDRLVTVEADGSGVRTGVSTVDA